MTCPLPQAPEAFGRARTMPLNWVADPEEVAADDPLVSSGSEVTTMVAHPEPTTVGAAGTFAPSLPGFGPVGDGQAGCAPLVLAFVPRREPDWVTFVPGGGLKANCRDPAWRSRPT